MSDPYREIAAGFDRSANQYDLETTTNPAMSYMRQVSLRALLATFAPGQRVLELGCGTGEEAIALGRHGVRVLATDVSVQMLSIAAEKAKAAGLAQDVQTRLMAAGEIDVLVDEFGAGAFDGVYSSFGPLNGEPDLERVSRSLTELTRPGSPLVASVMNQFYAFEVAWYLAHLRPQQATRRWRDKTIAKVSPDLPVSVPTWYYTPRTFARAFPSFRKTRCRALTLLLPPPYASHLWKRFPGMMRHLMPWEDRLSTLWPLSALGDHFLITMERR